MHTYNFYGKKEIYRKSNIFQKNQKKSEAQASLFIIYLKIIYSTVTDFAKLRG